MVSHRRQIIDLCRSLGLSEKRPSVIEVLVNNRRQIDVVNLAFAFGLTEQFSLVPLLKSYLEEARKASSPAWPGNDSPTTRVFFTPLIQGDSLDRSRLDQLSYQLAVGLGTEVSEQELTTLKAVIKCIEEHNLEEQYPVDPLQKWF
ncbi:FRIGIDA-like protein 3 [Durio zibethinus]|uniref:FRIGIDA-like protein n=1 Tax=Durio zibethinus TaxID=66656 RepID=A0A6P5WXF6_DURZI|nr:FRIGIDA-like protein 3 [Durio zibethinus]